MTRTSPILDQFGRHVTLPVNEPSSYYDAAQTTKANDRHWQGADALSARAANSADVRKKLRERARYEAANNGHCSGMIESVAGDLISSGPRLKLSIPGNPEASRAIERRFRAWSQDRTVNYFDKLRIACESEIRDGEIFCVLTTNPRVRDRVQLCPELLEAEQCTTPWGKVDTQYFNDGIEYDRYRNPVAYNFLRQHPGDTFYYPTQNVDRIDASQVIHWFRASRAGQCRGIPRITPGLNMLAQTRRFCLATLAAAELAATYAAVMKTNLPPDTYAAQWKAFDDIPLVPGMMVSLPPGWDMSQIEAKHPISSYKDFKETNLTEVGRPVHAPRNIVTGDSSPYNFSSARLDRIIYQSAINRDRQRLRTVVLDPVFVAWLDEALLIPGYLPDNLPAVVDWAWAWQYDGMPSINPVDDANAAQTRIACGLTTYSDELALEGKSVEEHFQKLADERQMARDLGIEDLLWPDQLEIAAKTPPQPAHNPDQPPQGNPDPAPAERGLAHV